jgi:hypothetical protein
VLHRLAPFEPGLFIPIRFSDHRWLALFFCCVLVLVIVIIVMVVRARRLRPFVQQSKPLFLYGSGSL